MAGVNCVLKVRANSERGEGVLDGGGERLGVRGDGGRGYQDGHDPSVPWERARGFWEDQAGLEEYTCLKRRAIQS